MNTLILILQLIPTLLEMIVAIENTAPVPQVGTAKANLVSQMVTTSMSGSTFTKHTISQDQLLSIIQAITVSIVSFYNLVGIFKHTPAAPVATATPSTTN